jgi:hypothetical protein
VLLTLHTPTNWDTQLPANVDSSRRIIIRSEQIIEMAGARRRINAVALKIGHGLDFYIWLWDAGPTFEVARRLGEK